MGINAKTQRFKEELVELINSCGLPACVVEMVLGNTLSIVQQKLKEAIALEMEGKDE